MWEQWLLWNIYIAFCEGSVNSGVWFFGIIQLLNYMYSGCEEKTGIESRATILGHVQRGGNPSVRDRVMASLMGNAAVELLRQGIGNRVVCYDKGIIINRDIFEALQMVKPLDSDLYRIADMISF